MANDLIKWEEKAVIELNKENIAIYLGMPEMPVSRQLEFEGSWGQFLTLIKKAGIKLVYHDEQVPDDTKPGSKETIVAIRFGFMHEGILHTYSMWLDSFLAQNNKG
jgi:hypothetical protein